MIGVLVMSLPGGSCFLWQGLGIDHHHHSTEGEVLGEPDVCFHDHDHGCSGAEEKPQSPSEPCDSENGAEPLVFETILKVDPGALLAVGDFVPDWLVEIRNGAVFGVFATDGSQRVHPPPDVRLLHCCFLI